MQTEDSFMLFAGSSHEALANEIAGELHIKLGEVHRETFPDGEIGIQIRENVRGKDVFILQSLARRPNHFLMELLIMVDALKRASARSIVAVLPYYAYARQDRKDKSRMPITARLVANLLERAGVTRVLSMDLHTEQIQGFFDIPVDHLYARPLFIRTFKNLGLKNLVVVSPDVGSNRMARKFAEELHADLAIVDKRRLSADNVEVHAIIGDVKSRHVLLVDDIWSTGVTLKKAAQACLQYGALSVTVAVTHGLFLGDGLQDSGIDRVYVADTIPSKIYRNDLRNREFGKEVPQNFDLERATIAGRQGATENHNSEVKPTPPKTDSSGCFGIEPLYKANCEVSYVPTAPLFAAAIDCVVKAKSITSLFTSD